METDKKYLRYVQGRTITGAVTNGTVSATILCWYSGTFPSV